MLLSGESGESARLLLEEGYPLAWNQSHTTFSKFFPTPSIPFEQPTILNQLLYHLVAVHNIPFSPAPKPHNLLLPPAKKAHGGEIPLSYNRYS